MPESAHTPVAESLFFDLDGTLTDPRDGITRCLRYALDGVQVPAPTDAELTRWIGPPLHDSFRDFLGPSRRHLVARAVSLYRERFGTVGMFENSVYPGVPEGLRLLVESGRRLFVVTSKPTHFARPILQHFDLSRFFVGVYGSELSGERSDKGELISHVLRTEGLESNDALMIGDRAHDVRGARQNQVRAIGALWGYGGREELSDAGANDLYASVSELVAALLAASS
ncbi:MAG TPA: HAD hydrolase-like protein [Polyangiaceae bacterium]